MLDTFYIDKKYGENWKIKKFTCGVILVNFTENNNHGCNNNCSFCTAAELNYNIYMYPTDENLIEYMNNYFTKNAIMEISGNGDPLYNFEKNKEKIFHLCNIIHQYDHTVELVTQNYAVIEQNFNELNNYIDIYSISTEELSENLLKLINKLLAHNKKVRITKVLNKQSISNVNEVDWNEIENYLSFYNINSQNFSISIKCNFKYIISKELLRELLNYYKNISIKYFPKNNIVRNNFFLPQLWNNKIISCNDTQEMLHLEMNK